MRWREILAIIVGIAALPLAAHAQEASAVSADSSRCPHIPDGFPQRVDGPRWNGWGVDINNSRFQPAAMAGLTPEQVPRLQLKWAFGFPGASAANAQPTIVGGLLFVGGGDRKVYALDAKSGCIRWTFATEAVVRTAISVGPISGTEQFAAFFGDVRASVYAVNATTGALMWKTKVEDHPAARIVGAPTLYSSVLYVPVSSFEEATGSQPNYQCCTFRGSVVALDSGTGRQICKAYTIPEAPRPINRNAMEPSSMVRPVQPSGRHRPSMSSITRSMSRLVTAIRIRQQKRAMQFLRLTLRPAGCSGIGRPQQRTASMWLVTVLTRPIARKTMVQTATLANRPSW